MLLIRALSIAAMMLAFAASASGAKRPLTHYTHQRWSEESDLPRAGLPADLSAFDWVLGVQDMQLKGPVDYIVRNPANGIAYLYNGRKKGVSAPRVLGEGMGAYDLAG